MKKLIATLLCILPLAACSYDGNNANSVGCELVREWPKDQADYDGDIWHLWIPSGPGYQIVKIVEVASPEEDTCWTAL